ncbi:hypothetical protein RHGRI_033997 [Rhododendron griersonianum]|uniref:Uncharacterized protein n=1 Tax=Rhododendron griersonianum TaxID=479676 RepID=A0AAV6HZR0_9ERIC|nr:hypothetical protein RHGRI_033997 [Rhododendron griersonianum]
MPSITATTGAADDDVHDILVPDLRFPLISVVVVAAAALSPWPLELVGDGEVGSAPICAVEDRGGVVEEEDDGVAGAELVVDGPAHWTAKADSS